MILDLSGLFDHKSKIIRNRWWAPDRV